MPQLIIGETSTGRKVAVRVTSSGEVVISGGAGTDSTGADLPSDFDTLPSTFTYTGDNNIETEVKTSGATTWTQTYTWTSGNLTAISAWVRA